MRAIWAILVIPSILILGSLGLTQQAFAAAPTIVTYDANDPDNLDNVYGNGDTLNIILSASSNATNNSIVTSGEITGNFTLSPNPLTGATFTAQWNADASELLITFSATGTRVSIGSSNVVVAGGNNLGIKLNNTDNTVMIAPGSTISLTGSFGISQGGGGACNGDCAQPTLGKDNNGIRVVENGFTYNGNPIDVERYFTPYPLITVQVGVPNKAVFKIYENGGPDDIRHFELAFGLANGARIDTTNAAIVWDKTFGGMETVTLIDPENVLENVRVETSEGKCKEASAKNDCLIITIDHTFRAPLDFNIVGTYVWDENRNGWQNYYNDGIAIEGESLNPSKEYQGIHKGHLITITETGKNKAVDEQGNTWTFDGPRNPNTWKMDYIYTGKIDDGVTSQLYDRNHVSFNTYKQGQELIAISSFEKYYKTSFSQESAFSEIDDIKFYEFPDTIDKKFDPVLQAKMHEEDIRAQKYLEEMFAKMYPGLVYD